MGKIKVAKRVPFFVNISYKLNGDTIEQIFSFRTTNKKYLKYAYDQRYCLKLKIERLIDNSLLSDCSFIGRIESEEKIIMQYRNDFGSFDNSARIVNCEFYLPPFNGCLYCNKCKEEGDFLYCETKKKHYDSQGIKNCPVFQSIEEIIT